MSDRTWTRTAWIDNRAENGETFPGSRPKRRRQSEVPPNSDDTTARRVRVFVLVLICASLLLPKLLLVDFYSALWISLTPLDLVVVASQDIVLAATVFLASRWLLNRRSLVRIAQVAAVTTVLLVFLLIDVRVREVWLRPLDLDLLRYGWDNRSDLVSGLELFFNVKAGWDMTFRRCLFLLLALHASLWGVFAWVHQSIERRVSGARKRRSVYPAYIAAGMGGSALLVSLVGGQYRYGLQGNSMIEPAMTVLRSSSRNASSPTDFEQIPVAFHSTLTAPRQILVDAEPYQRLVIVFLESFRWRDAAMMETAYPTLHRLASEGLLSKTYAPVPHSSKGYYSVLSGRYPYPGIEIRESIPMRHESFVHSLRSGLKADTYAFTSMHLAFENTGGLLRSLGFEHRYELKDLMPPGAVVDPPVSSFGGGDSYLYELAAERLAAVPGPFIAALLPFGAHYPYDYPDKPTEEGASYDAYKRSLAESDRQLGLMLAHFEAHSLLDDTLFVFVGDHGEAFGEHGVFAHNSSVYEEEVAVPALLWSADKRLRYDEVILSRQIDLAPTILDLFGYHGDSTPVQGVSLLRSDGPLPAYFSTFFDNVALGLLEYPDKYIYEPADERLLRFNLVHDPTEARGVLVSEPQRSKLISRMKAFQQFQKASFPR